jgi:hypothetical protein
VGSVRSHSSATTRTGRVGPLLKAAADPRTAGQLARLRRTELTLTSLTPRPTVVTLLGVTSRVGATTLTALLAQSLGVLAPGRVAALDGDGIGPALGNRLSVRAAGRGRAATGPAGGLRQMLAAPEVWRRRRQVDRYLTPGIVPVLAAASSEGGRPLRDNEVETALHLLRRRYPVVVADLPASAARVAAALADHVILVAPHGSQELQQAHRWLLAHRPGRPAGSLTTMAPPPRPRQPTVAGVDIMVPVDPALARPGRLRVCDLQLPTLAAVEAVTCRVAASWREPTAGPGSPRR